jgi:hypothetical protein
VIFCNPAFMQVIINKNMYEQQQTVAVFRHHVESMDTVVHSGSLLYLCYHFYQGNYWNSIQLTEAHFDNIRMCRIISLNFWLKNLKSYDQKRPLFDRSRINLCSSPSEKTTAMNFIQLKLWRPQAKKKKQAKRGEVKVYHSLHLYILSAPCCSVSFMLPCNVKNNCG